MISRSKLISYCGIGLVVAAIALLSGVVESPTLSAQVEDENLETGPDLLGKKHGKTHVQIRVRDDLWNDVHIESAALDGKDVRLHRKSNIFGLRGTLDTQLAPGDYTVRWTVTKPSSKGHRITLSFQKTFRVSRKGGVTVVITGQKASVY
jgi:hypothetical protein